MRRPYTSAEFATLVSEIRRRVPGIAVTTDVIVGFPGESPGEFEESLEFCRQMAFSRLHAFPFSPRPGTEAADLPDQIPSPVKRRRMERMLSVARQSHEHFAQCHAETTAEVLWEYQRDGAWYGMTDNYLRVVIECSDDLSYRITPVLLMKLGDVGLTCSLSPATNR